MRGWSTRWVALGVVLLAAGARGQEAEAAPTAVEVKLHDVAVKVRSASRWDSVEITQWELVFGRERRKSTTLLYFNTFAQASLISCPRLKASNIRPMLSRA